MRLVNIFTTDNRNVLLNVDKISSIEITDDVLDIVMINTDDTYEVVYQTKMSMSEFLRACENAWFISDTKSD